MKDKYENKIYGYVIMPNHIHVLFYVSEKSPALPKLIQNAKRFLAYKIVEYLEGDNRQDVLRVFSENARVNKGSWHKVFTDRYDSKFVENLDFFNEKLNYIHENPCRDKWKLVKRPEDFKHSSASNYLLGEGYYDVDIMTS